VLSLSLVPDSLRTVLAVKGSRRRAKLRPALDGSGPFSKTFQGRGKGSRCKGHAGNNLRNQPESGLRDYQQITGSTSREELIVPIAMEFLSSKL
jgi:hypothetical protein